MLGQVSVARMNLEIKKETAEVVEDFEDRNEQLQEEIPEARLTEDYLDARIDQHLSNEVFGYFSLSAALVEQYAVELLQSELIEEEY